MKLTITGGIQEDSPNINGWSYNVHECEKGHLLFQSEVLDIDEHYIISRCYPLLGEGSRMILGVMHTSKEADDRAYKEAVDFANLKKGSEPREVTDQSTQARRAKVKQLEKLVGIDLSTDRGMP